MELGGLSAALGRESEGDPAARKGHRQQFLARSIRLPGEEPPTDAGDQARVFGGPGWTSSAGPSCLGPSPALSWPVVRRTGARAARRVRPGQFTLSRHVRPARCLASRVSRQHRPSRIQFPAGRLVPTARRGRRSSGGIPAGNRLPGVRLFQAWYCGCRHPSEWLL